MKKLKLLLPIAAVGTMAAAATPLLVSCGANQNPYQTTINGESVYIPTIERAKSDRGILDTEAANKLYWDDVEENNDIIIQDLLYSITSKAYMAKRGAIIIDPVYYNAYSYEYIFFEGNTDININYSNLSIDATKQTISITIEGVCKADLYLGEEVIFSNGNAGLINYGYITLDLSHFKFEFENIPYGVDYEYIFDGKIRKDDKPAHWIIGPAVNGDEWLDSTKFVGEATGSVYSSAAGRVYVYNNESSEITKKTKLPEHIVLGDAIILLQGLLFIYGTSYHLSDIAVLSEE